MHKLDLLELTTEMSVTVIDYTYAIYNWQSLSFGVKRIGPTYVIRLHMHLHE
jgi:hypothetical protein